MHSYCRMKPAHLKTIILSFLNIYFSFCFSVPKRNLQQMSAFIQFVEYCDMKLSDLNDKLDIVRSRKTRQRELIQSIDDLRERKNTRALQRTKMIDEKSEVLLLN